MGANRPRSLRRQLLIWLLAMLIPLLLIGTVSSYYRANYFANLAYDRSLLRAALALADQIEVEHGQVKVDLPQIARDLIEYDKDDWIYYRLRGPAGELITGQADLPLPKRMPTAGNHVYYDTILEGKSLRVVAFALPLAGTSAEGMVTVLVAETRAKRDFMAEEIIATMMLPQLLIVILAGLMIHYGILRGLATLERLRAAIGRRSLEDLSPVAEEDAPSEVQPLLHAMNDLLQRLRDSIDKQHRFIANASHQLRTPLAGLKTQAELALREEDPAKVRHALLQIRASSSSLSRLVSQLLSLARAEPEATGTLELEVLDLSRLAQYVSSEWVPQALAKNIDLGFAGAQDGCSVTGNTMLLRELLNNLIDNAIRYTPAGGHVTVAVKKSPGAIELSVQDNGPGIPEDNQQRVFERFYRILGTGQEGCGLGLTIVREIALRHRAEVHLQHADRDTNTGTLISVTFPPAY